MSSSSWYGMQLREAVEPRELLVDDGVVLHRARAERVHPLVEVVIAPREASEVAREHRLRHRGHGRRRGAQQRLGNRRGAAGRRNARCGHRGSARVVGAQLEDERLVDRPPGLARSRRESCRSCVCHRNCALRRDHVCSRGGVTVDRRRRGELGAAHEQLVRRAWRRCVRAAVPRRCRAGATRSRTTRRCRACAARTPRETASTDWRARARRWRVRRFARWWARCALTSATARIPPAPMCAMYTVAASAISAWLVQMLEVACSRRMCCSRACRVSV